ncbi:hypothetical protein QUT57_22900, partial [Xanthomonas citri pv. citri]
MDIVARLSTFSTGEIAAFLSNLSFNSKHEAIPVAITANFKTATIITRLEQISNYGRFAEHSLTDIKEIIQQGLLQYFPNINFDVLNLAFMFRISDGLAPLQEAIDFALDSTFDVIQRTHALL